MASSISFSNRRTSIDWLLPVMAAHSGDGVVDVTVTSECVDDDWFERTTTSSSMVTEPKVFPHELQQLKDGQVVCTYQDLAWRGWATPYFQTLDDYLGKRPTGQQLYGEPNPEKADDDAA